MTTVTTNIYEAPNVSNSVLRAFTNIISFNPYSTSAGKYCYYSHSTDEKCQLKSLSGIQGHTVPK